MPKSTASFRDISLPLLSSTNLPVSLLIFPAVNASAKDIASVSGERDLLNPSNSRSNASSGDSDFSAILSVVSFGSSTSGDNDCRNFSISLASCTSTGSDVVPSSGGVMVSSVCIGGSVSDWPVSMSTDAGDLAPGGVAVETSSIPRLTASSNEIGFPLSGSITSPV